MLQRTVLALATVVAMTLPAMADDTADTTPPVCQRNGSPVPDDDMKAARDAMTLSGAGKRFETVITAMVPQLMGELRRSSPDITEAVAQELATELQNELLKGEDDLMAVSACIYAQHYTGDELRQLKAFYGTPLGQKLISEGPAVLKDSIAVGQAWGRRAGLAAVQHVLARHKKDGDKT